LRKPTEDDSPLTQSLVKGRSSVTQELSDIIDAFQSVEVETRLELLLDFSRLLPELDERHAAERDAGIHRVPECMSPVFLWVEPDPPEIDSSNRTVHLILDVAEEAPTVKGFLSIILQAFDHHHAGEIAALPLDLVNRLGLSSVIRMNRAQGIAAIITRIRKGAAALSTHSTTTAAGGNNQ